MLKTFLKVKNCLCLFEKYLSGFLFVKAYPVLYIKCVTNYPIFLVKMSNEELFICLAG